jgi:chemotaxis methyl-accepting protein methylase
MSAAGSPVRRILICEAFAPAEPPVTIFATDISGDAVARARARVYEARAVRELDSVQRHRFFRRKGQQLIVGERLRSMITFARHNLTRDPFPPLGEAAFHPSRPWSRRPGTRSWPTRRGS